MWIIPSLLIAACEVSKEPQENTNILDSGESLQDLDGDGYSTYEGDCDDADPNISPTAPDLMGDDIDQNCDGADGLDADGDGYSNMASGGLDCDDTDPLMYPVDQDGDGFTLCDGDCDDTTGVLNLADADGDGQSSCAGDCDDFNSDVYIGIAYREPEPACTKDVDGDGYGDAYALAPIVAGQDCDDNDYILNALDFDGDGQSTCAGDCDDTNISVYLGAAYIEGPNSCMSDFDQDGYGSSVLNGNIALGTDCDDQDATLNRADADGDGQSSCAGDCDDNSAIKNVLDLDNDGHTSCYDDCDDNDAFTYFGAAIYDSLTACMTDADGDGYGDISGPTIGSDCDDSDASRYPVDADNDGYTLCDDDCDDTDPYTFPGAAYIESPTACATDVDGDGYISIANGGTDCNDFAPLVNPQQVDFIGDGIDSNCDLIDGEDSDGDGEASIASGGTDCNDTDPSISSIDFDGDGASVCDGDCNDLLVSQNILDADGDGFSTCSDDCDDADPLTYPGAAIYDSLTACMTDADGDGYGSNTSLTPGSDCDDQDAQKNHLDSDGDGVSSCSGDCDDTNPSIFPILLNGQQECFSAEIAVSETDIILETELGCTSSELIIIENQGSSDLEIDAIDVANPDLDIAILENYNGPLPWSVEPSGSKSVYVTHTPMGLGAVSDTLNISSNATNENVIGIPVTASVTPPLTAEINVRYGATTDIDIIVLVDTDSEPVGLDRFKSELETLVGGLNSLGSSFQLGVISASNGCIGDINSIITENTPTADIGLQLDNMFSSGGQSTSNLRDMTWSVIQQIESTECNDGLVRGTAPVGIVYWGTELEQSTIDNAVLLYSIQQDVGSQTRIFSFSDEQGTCFYEQPLWLELVTDSGGQHYDICEADIGNSIWNLMYELVDTDVIRLNGEPWVSSISVELNGVNLGLGWVYDSGLKEVVFSPNLPNYGSDIDVTYWQIGECSY